MKEFETRYSFGGDEFLFVELSEEFSLRNIFRIISITRILKEKNIKGVYDICPANASFMIRFNPDIIHPEELKAIVKEIENQTNDLEQVKFKSRLVEIPILFEDPWTTETVMKFREYHQDPTLTDIQYCAKINGYNSTEAFIDAITSAPWLTINVGFVPGLPWCYQLVSQEKQIEVPKYIRPRTETPERSFGYAGAFALFYPTAGTGGAQLFGITPGPVFEKEQKLIDFKESMVFPIPGDIYKFNSITMEEYLNYRKQVEEGTFEYRKIDFEFSANQVLDDIENFSKLVEGRFQYD